MSKSAEAFRTIGEVADELGVPKHVLRFWEGKFAHIRPMKRGGGRRYYRPEDMELLRGIRTLLHSNGYTIKGVQKILRDQGVEQVKAAARLAAEGAVSSGVEPPRKRSRKHKGQAREDGSVSTPAVAPASAVAAPASARDERLGLAAVIRDLETARAILLGKPLPHRDVSPPDPGQERAGPL